MLATSGAVVTALGLNSLAKVTFQTPAKLCLLKYCVKLFHFLGSQKAPPLVGRLVPFAAVAAANCINIPLMRRR